MHRIFRVKAYEKEHGPHFNEEYARKAVMKMENEDGTRGPHWSLEETTTLASQYGIALGSKFNRYDWFVALNMVYSDYYRVIMNILDVRQASPTASASLPVGLSDSESDNTTQSLLRNALQEDVQAGDLQVNFRYLIYYNKCNNTYQLVNAYPANIATPGA